MDQDAQARADGFGSADARDLEERVYWEEALAEAVALGHVELWKLYRDSGAEQTPLPSPSLSVVAFAHLAGVHPDTIRRRLPQLVEDSYAYKFRGRWRIKPEGLESLKNRPRTPTPAPRSKRRTKPQASSDSEVW